MYKRTPVVEQLAYVSMESWKCCNLPQGDQMGTHNEQNAKAQSVVCSEELSMRPIGILLIVSIEGAAIFQGVVVCSFLDCMVEDDVG
jgi:hypothetical protein